MTFFTVSSCTVAVTEFMDVIHDGQFAECEVLELCSPRTRTLYWSLMILEDKNFPQGLQHYVCLGVWCADKFLL